MATSGKRHGFAHVNEHIGAHIALDKLCRELASDDPSVAMSAFSGITLPSMAVRDATLEQLVFKDCMFDHVRVTGSGVADVRFVGCRFIGCAFERCWLNRIDFEACSAPGLTFLKSRLTSVSIDECQLRYADFSEVNARALRLRNSGLMESTWYGATLSRPRFEKCDLTRAEVVRTSLTGVDLATCSIGGLTVSNDFRELRGCIIAPEQATDLVGLLGVRFAD